MDLHCMLDALHRFDRVCDFKIVHDMSHPSPSFSAIDNCDCLLPGGRRGRGHAAALPRGRREQQPVLRPEPGRGRRRCQGEHTRIKRCCRAREKGRTPTRAPFGALVACASDMAVHAEKLPIMAALAMACCRGRLSTRC